MVKNDLYKELSERMESSLKILDHELKGLRTSRASVNFLDPVLVEIHGSRTPIAHLATLSTPDARTISVQIWDKDSVKAVEKAIADSNLGINPVVEGQNIRLSLPPLTEERRKELVKLAHKYCENTKIALRNVRRDGNEALKKLEKNGEISKDDLRDSSEKIQKLTDSFIEKAEEYVKKKESEISKV